MAAATVVRGTESFTNSPRVHMPNPALTHPSAYTPLAATTVVLKAFERHISNAMRAPTAVAVSLDGAHVYVAAEHSASIAVFARDPISGLLLNPKPCATPKGVGFRVAGEDFASIAVFSRDPISGLLALRPPPSVVRPYTCLRLSFLHLPPVFVTTPARVFFWSCACRGI